MFRTLILCLVLVAVPPSLAAAQELTTPEGLPVRSTEVSGIGRGQLSPGLRQAIDALVDTPYSENEVDALARRIEEEQPDYVAVARAVPLPPDGVRVIFLAARIGDAEDVDLNINERYTVESVEISGVPETDVRPPLRDEMETLVGERLDAERAEEIEGELEAAVSGYEVTRRIERGSQEGQIRVVFEFRKIPWIPFRRSRNILAYHSKQGWSGGLDLPMAFEGDHRVTVGLHFGNNDARIERYYGYTIGYENRRAGTERLGFGIEFFSLRGKWTPASLAAIAASPEIPEAYRDRQTVEPSVTFAFSPSLRVVAGTSLSNLESLVAPPQSMSANAGFASLFYQHEWEASSEATHGLLAGYSVRSATHNLDSDLIYTRHAGQVRYQYERGPNTLISDFSAGHSSGRAPLFERFSLGNTSTLRGWNKYDVAPAGGDDFVHHTLEYRHKGGAVFFDTGSVWNRGQEAKIRLSAGIGYHDGPFALTVGFPLSSNGVGAMFMMRFGFSPEWRFRF